MSKWIYMLPIMRFDTSIVPQHRRLGLERCGPRAFPVRPHWDDYLPVDGQAIIAQARDGRKMRTRFRRLKETATEIRWVEPLDGSRMYRWKAVE